MLLPGSIQRLDPNWNFYVIKDVSKVHIALTG